MRELPHVGDARGQQGVRLPLSAKQLTVFESGPGYGIVIACLSLSTRHDLDQARSARAGGCRNILFSSRDNASANHVTSKLSTP